MNPSTSKEVMKAIKANNLARIKAIAQRVRTTPGKLVALAKKSKKGK